MARSTSSTLLQFTKMQGLGNDFIVVDEMLMPAQKPESLEHAVTKPEHSLTTSERAAAAPKITPELARKICDRRFGVGADQVLILRAPSASNADFKMDILNADGSVAEMCGNGIRAAALFYHDRAAANAPHASHASQKSSYKIETLAGLIEAQVQGQANNRRVTVDMGVPRLGAECSGQGERLEIKTGAAGAARVTLPFYEVSMGNPHAVFFVKDGAASPNLTELDDLGPLIESHPRFPQRTNVEFVKVEDSHSIRVRLWERGAGLTLACGTGACASAVAALITQRAQSPVTVKLPGGDLLIRWAGEGSPVLMEGPAEEVFTGTFPVK